MFSSLVVLASLISIFSLDYIEYQYAPEIKIAVSALIFVLYVRKAGEAYSEKLFRLAFDQRAENLAKSVDVLKKHNKVLVDGYNSMKNQAEALVDQNKRLLDELKKHCT